MGTSCGCILSVFYFQFSYFVPLLEELVVVLVVTIKGVGFMGGGVEENYIYIFFSSYTGIGKLSPICQVLTAVCAKCWKCCSESADGDFLCNRWAIRESLIGHDLSPLEMVDPGNWSIYFFAGEKNIKISSLHSYLSYEYEKGLAPLLSTHYNTF